MRLFSQIKSAGFSSSTRNLANFTFRTNFIKGRSFSSETPVFQPKFIDKIPEGDDKIRQVCETCGFINYQNPKIITGSVIYSPPDGRILLTRRAIEPRKGYWAHCGGFMELKESLDESAKREASVTNETTFLDLIFFEGRMWCNN